VGHFDGTYDPDLDGDAELSLLALDVYEALGETVPRSGAK
jgi:hypothetical protein